MATAHAAIQTLVEEGMIENSKRMGDLFMSELKKIRSPLIKEVRGRGLFIGVEVKKEDGIKVDGKEGVVDLCIRARERHDGGGVMMCGGFRFEGIEFVARCALIASQVRSRPLYVRWTSNGWMMSSIAGETKRLLE